MSGRNNRTILRTLGLFLIIVGALLCIIGLIGLNTPLSCPANGCSSEVVARTYLPYWISVYSGVSLIVIGIALLLVSRRAKLKSPDR